MKLANIIYADDLVNHQELPYINYIKFIDGELEFDSSLPTLFVGWMLVKKLGKDIDILNKTIKKNEEYWEFSFEEKKSDHINGVHEFSLTIPILFFREKYEYINVNPIYDNIKLIDDTFKHLPSQFNVCYNYNGNMLYLLEEVKNISGFQRDRIYGIDFELFNFFDLDLEEIKNKLYENSDTVLEDLDGLLAKKTLSGFINSNHLRKYLPCILKN